jgi:integrase
VFSKFCSRKGGRDFGSIVQDWRKAKRGSLDDRETFLENWSDIVRSFHTFLSKKYAPLTVKNFLSTVRSFFTEYEIPVKVKLPKRACVIYHNRDLTKEDVKLILTYASPRDRVLWLMLAESGMRVGSAVKLKYWQIKEGFEAEEIPMQIMLPAASLKDHVGDRWTFIGEDGFRALKEYLAPRLPLRDDDYVFTSEFEGKVKGEQFSVASLSTKFARLVSKLGLCESRRNKPRAVRQHGLRKYFRNNVRADSAYREFWMGHSLGTDTHYIGRAVEEHRRRYAEGYSSLRVYEPRGTEQIDDLKKLLEDKDRELAQLKESLGVLSPLLEFVEENPVALKGFLGKMKETERQRWLTFTRRWSKRVGIA